MLSPFPSWSYQNTPIRVRVLLTVVNSTVISYITDIYEASIETEELHVLCSALFWHSKIHIIFFSIFSSWCFPVFLPQEHVDVQCSRRYRGTVKQVQDTCYLCNVPCRDDRLWSYLSVGHLLLEAREVKHVKHIDRIKSRAAKEEQEAWLANTDSVHN